MTNGDQEAAQRAREARDAYLRKTYGITAEEYTELLVSQNGGCAICGATAKTRALHVDHDHKTGMIRGILCYTHNKRLLPAVKDNPAILRAAADYLENPPFPDLFGVRAVPDIKRKKRRRRKTL